MFSLLLVATGAAKLWRPHDTARAIRAVGLPFALALTLLLGVAEIVVGGLALAAPSALAMGAQATLYGAFLVWVVVALRRKVPLASCGCLGRDDTPPYWGHVVIDASAVLVSAVTAVTGSLVWVVESGLATATHVILVAAGAWMAWNVIGVAATATARRPA